MNHDVHLGDSINPRSLRKKLAVVFFLLGRKREKIMEMIYLDLSGSFSYKVMI